MRWREEAALLLAAAGFLTRLRMPARGGWSDDRMVKASRYFPLVGALVGAFGGVVWWLAGLALPPALAAGLAVAATVWVTGALHEDGLADCADGLGGGRDRETALAIMRDSRTGSYGVLALVLSVGLRWAALASLAPGTGALALVMAGGIGRGMMVFATALAGYARPEGVGALVARGAGLAEISVALASVVLLAVLGGWAGVLALFLAAALCRGFLRLMVRKVGGYTGDGLGALAQIGEVAVMVTLAGAWA